jgi:hypothetical protein
MCSWTGLQWTFPAPDDAPDLRFSDICVCLPGEVVKIRPITIEQKNPPARAGIFVNDAFRHTFIAPFWTHQYPAFGHIAADHDPSRSIRGDAMEWDPELLAKLRELRESREVRELRELRELREVRKEASPRRKQRTPSLRSANQAATSEIKMIVSQWYTDEFGNRARMIYNAKTADFEVPSDSPLGGFAGVTS